MTCGAARRLFDRDLDSRLSPAERQRAYRSDVTYLTVKEAGFDLLRDGLLPAVDRMIAALSTGAGNPYRELLLAILLLLRPAAVDAGAPRRAEVR